MKCPKCGSTNISVASDAQSYTRRCIDCGYQTDEAPRQRRMAAVLLGREAP